MVVVIDLNETVDSDEIDEIDENAKDIAEMFGLSTCDCCLIWLGGNIANIGEDHVTREKLVLKVRDINNQFVIDMNNAIRAYTWLFDSKIMVHEDIMLIMYIDGEENIPSMCEILDMFQPDTFVKYIPYTVDGRKTYNPCLLWIGLSDMADAPCLPLY
jgi:hypothetical protein